MKQSDSLNTRLYYGIVSILV